MINRLTLAAALGAAVLALPGTALARGGSGSGGGGGTSTTPPPTTDPVVLCDYSLDGVQPDGSNLFSNQVADAGCVTVRQFNGTLTLYKATAVAPWSYVVTSNGGGTNSRVALTYTNSVTNQKIDVRIEFGKTKIG
jgi:hypothetical protein